MSTKFKKKIEEVERTAKVYGYKSKRDISTFVNGWVAGFAYLFADKDLHIVRGQVPTRKQFLDKTNRRKRVKGRG